MFASATGERGHVEESAELAESRDSKSNRLSDVPVAPESQGPYEAVCALVAAEDLSVVFQPILRMDDGSLFAHEALCRCRVAEYSSPPELFHKAVQSGTTGEL